MTPEQTETPQERPNQILSAVIAKFEADRLEAIATLNLYLNQPLGIADHPNIVGEAVTLVQRIASAEGSLRTLQAATTPPPEVTGNGTQPSPTI